MVDVSQSMGAFEPNRGPAVAVIERLTAAKSVADGSLAMRSVARAGDFSNRQIAALFCVLAAITAIPILLFPLPPLSDYINHLSRMHVIASVDSDPDLARFYQVTWQIIPNLMMDMVVPLLERFMNVYLAGQLYTIGSFVLILSGTLALNRQLYGHWSVLPLIAFPLLYNSVFLVGTMNYVFGIGLALWALTAWVAMRERGLALRLSLSSVFVLGLFFCHLFSVGVYGLGLLAFELHRLRSRIHASTDRSGQPGLLPVLEFVATGVPFLPVLPLLMMSPTWGLRGTVSWELNGKLNGLLFVVEVYSDLATILLTGIVALAVVLGLRKRALQFHPFGWILLGLGAVVYMAMPRVIFETYMADQRLPIALAFMTVACAHINLRQPQVRLVFASALVMLLAIRVFEVQDGWRELSLSTNSFHESIRHLDRGSKILVAYADPDGGDDVRDLGLMHAACLAIIERSSLVTTAFTVVGKQIMHTREDYRARVDAVDGTPPTINQLLQVADPADDGQPQYWSRWTTDYDYVYVLFTDPDYQNPAPSQLTPIFAGDRFVLYRVNNSFAAADPRPH
jgi:hypothetical protein